MEDEKEDDRRAEYGDENEEPVCVSVENNTGNPEMPGPSDDCVVVKGLRKVKDSMEPEKCKRAGKKGQCEKDSGHSGKCRLIKGKNGSWKFSSSHKIRTLKERETQVKRKRIEEERVEVERVRLVGSNLKAKIEELKEQCTAEKLKGNVVKEQLSQEEELFERRKQEIMKETENIEAAQLKEKKNLEELKKKVGDFELEVDTEHKLKEKQNTLDELNDRYNKVRILYEQKGYSRKRREQNPTTMGMTTSQSSRTRFDRKKETKNALECLHGGKFGAILGAWDFLQTSCDRDMIYKLITGYKKGKFIQQKLNELTKKFETGDDSLRKAIVMKYETSCHVINTNSYQKRWIPFMTEINKLGCQGIKRLIV